LLVALNISLRDSQINQAQKTPIGPGLLLWQDRLLTARSGQSLGKKNRHEVG